VEAVMGPEEIAAITLRHGAEYPYDAPDDWWNGYGGSQPPTTDWAHSAARGILAEIVASLAEIIRQAAKEPRP